MTHPAEKDAGEIAARFVVQGETCEECESTGRNCPLHETRPIPPAKTP